MPSKKRRTLAGFDAVAEEFTRSMEKQIDEVIDEAFSKNTNDDVNIDANNDTNDDTNKNINNDDNVNVNNDTNNHTSNNVNNNDDVNVNVDGNAGRQTGAPETPPPKQRPPRAPRSAGGNKEKPEAQKIAEDDEESGSILDELLGKSQRIEDTHVMRGIYIEKQLDKIIDRLAKKGGRGVKSKLVNEALKKLFREKGLL